VQSPTKPLSKRKGVTGGQLPVTPFWSSKRVSVLRAERGSLVTLDTASYDSAKADERSAQQQHS
jgi:hypothetical protein